jgi:hypothetical protein
VIEVFCCRLRLISVSLSQIVINGRLPQLPLPNDGQLPLFKICDVEMEMFVCSKGNGDGEEDGDDKGDGNGERW